MYIYSNGQENPVAFKSKRRKHGGLPLGDSFEFFFSNDCKMGKCKLCPTDKEFIVKMKDSNTTGVKRHLRDKHPKIYKKTYPDSE